jgi:hypothetical protein
VVIRQIRQPTGGPGSELLVIGLHARPVGVRLALDGATSLASLGGTVRAATVIGQRHTPRLWVFASDLTATGLVANGFNAGSVQLAIAQATASPGADLARTLDLALTGDLTLGSVQAGGLSLGRASTPIRLVRTPDGATTIDFDIMASGVAVHDAPVSRISRLGATGQARVLAPDLDVLDSASGTAEIALVARDLALQQAVRAGLPAPYDQWIAGGLDGRLRLEAAFNQRRAALSLVGPVEINAAGRPGDGAVVFTPKPGLASGFVLEAPTASRRREPWQVNLAAQGSVRAGLDGAGLAASLTSLQWANGALFVEAGPARWRNLSFGGLLTSGTLTSGRFNMVDGRPVGQASGTVEASGRLPDGTRLSGLELTYAATGTAQGWQARGTARSGKVGREGAGQASDLVGSFEASGSGNGWQARGLARASRIELAGQGDLRTVATRYQASGTGRAWAARIDGELAEARWGQNTVAGLRLQADLRASGQAPTGRQATTTGINATAQARSVTSGQTRRNQTRLNDVGLVLAGRSGGAAGLFSGDLGLRAARAIGPDLAIGDLVIDGPVQVAGLASGGNTVTFDLDGQARDLNASGTRMANVQVASQGTITVAGDRLSGGFSLRGDVRDIKQGQNSAARLHFVTRLGLHARAGRLDFTGLSGCIPAALAGVRAGGGSIHAVQVDICPQTGQPLLGLGAAGPRLAADAAISPIDLVMASNPDLPEGLRQTLRLGPSRLVVVNGPAGPRYALSASSLTYALPLEATPPTLVASAGLPLEDAAAAGASPDPGHRQFARRCQRLDGQFRPDGNHHCRPPGRSGIRHHDPQWFRSARNRPDHH